MKPLITNMIGAGRLNVATYEHVEADPRSTAGSAITVVLSTLAAGIGSGLTGVEDLAPLLVVTALTWLIWVALTYYIGTRLLPGPTTQATFGQVLRTTGFSASPGILRVFGTIPVIGLPLFVASTLWMLATFVVAIRQALDLTSTWRALFVSVLGWLIYALAGFAFVLQAI